MPSAQVTLTIDFEESLGGVAGTDTKDGNTPIKIVSLTVESNDPIPMRLGPKTKGPGILSKLLRSQLAAAAVANQGE